MYDDIAQLLDGVLEKALHPVRAAENFTGRNPFQLFSAP
jgi:hypothetical protein